MNSPNLPHGQSGALLRVLTYRGNTVVRKSSASINGNPRLRGQMEKQQAFLTLKTAVKTPEILDCGYDSEGLFYFDMKFIPGLDGHRFLETCAPKSMREFTEKISEHLHAISKLAMIGGKPKYRSLYDSSISKLTEVHSQKVGLSDELAGKILRALEVVRECDTKMQGFCHGDFTLENIIIDTRGELHFVDFLDSNFEHPIQDYIKLGQDIHGGWFRIRGRRISGSFVAHLEKMLTRNGLDTIPSYEKLRPVLLALNFCRILPYVGTQPLKSLVIDKINLFTSQSQ